MLKTNKEDDLVQQLKAGEAAAFDELFEIYGQKLYGFALKYLKSQTEAEELVQDVFVRIWENRKSLNSDFSFKSYLFTIALNQVRKYFKKRAMSLRYLASLKEDDFDLDNQTAEFVDYTSVLQRIDQVVASFPERKKQIFLKSRKEGKTSKQIAKELDITVGAVDNQISQAIKLIREALKNEGLVTLLFVALFLS
jgi:RNA polymerase sigma-70 factor (ECF subfamily)